MDSRVLWARVGASADQAIPVFGPTVTRKLGLGRLDVAALQFAPDSPWVIARTTDTTLPEGFLLVGRVADLGKKDFRWTRISGYADKIVEIDLRGNDLYFMTYAKAPRKEIMRLDRRQPALGKARLAAQAPPGGVLEDFSLTKDALIASVRQGTDVVLRRFGAGDTQGQALAMPGKGAARGPRRRPWLYRCAVHLQWLDADAAGLPVGWPSLHRHRLAHQPAPGRFARRGGGGRASAQPRWRHGAHDPYLQKGAAP
ncbi:MAG: hypothetical protein IPO43_06615 [Rhodoferax sp.]|nr:hypothetical protein [Rhodoferax sp.]